MSSAEQLQEYFQKMSQGEIKHHKTILAPPSHGIGACRQGRIMYKIQTGGAGPTVISPVQQALYQAKHAMGIKRKRSRSRSHSSRRSSGSRTRKRSKGKKKDRKKKKKKPKKKTGVKNKLVIGKKGKKKKSRNKKSWSDIFS